MYFKFTFFKYSIFDHKAVQWTHHRIPTTNPSAVEQTTVYFLYNMIFNFYKFILRDILFGRHSYQAQIFTT